VVGIAIGELAIGHPLDLFYLQMPQWTEEDKARAEEAKNRFDFFIDPVEKKIHEDEYPTTS